MKVRFSPMTTRGISYSRIAPVHMSHGDRVVTMVDAPVDRCRLPAGDLQRIGLAMADGAAQLDPPVVPGAEHPAARHQCCPDRDAALRQPDEGLGLGQLQQGAIIGHCHGGSVGGRDWVAWRDGYTRRQTEESPMVDKTPKKPPKKKQPKEAEGLALAGPACGATTSRRGGVSRCAVAGEWSGRRGSNPRHAAWKAAALPTELLPHRI